MFPKFVLFFSTICFIVAIDQLLKYKTRHSGEFYICNHGISFGIRLPNSLFWLLLGLFVFFTSFYVISLYKKVSFPSFFVFGLALLLGGALSNLVDRCLFGCVLDYISFLGNLFPTFNLADVGIFIGSCLIIKTFVSTPNKLTLF